MGEALSFWSKLAPKEKLMMAVVGGAGILVVFYMFLLRPNLDRASGLLQEQVKAEQQLETATNSLKRLKSLEKQSRTYEAQLIKAKKALPDEAEVSALLVELSSIVTDSGMEMDSFSPGAAAASGSAQSMPVTLSLKGGFFDLLDLLSRLQTAPRYLKIMGLTITPGERLTVSLSLTVFFVNAPPQASPQ